MLENLGFGKEHPLKLFPATTVLCDRDCYQTYLHLKQHPDTKSVAEVMRKWGTGPIHYQELSATSQQQIRISAYAKHRHNAVWYTATWCMS